MATRCLARIGSVLLQHYSGGIHSGRAMSLKGGGARFPLSSGMATKAKRGGSVLGSSFLLTLVLHAWRS